MGWPWRRPEVRAAGGVLRRVGKRGEPQIAIVHRPRHRDWSLPKGKLDPGESWRDAAVREVEEETGFRVRPGRRLGRTRYRDGKGRDKLVRYWLMDLADGEDGKGFVPNREVDKLRWVPPAEADELLTYEHDRALVGKVKDR
ncbi:MAG: NUDIX hydrolase [Actinobacteria bacterium]|nr:NUDIX hydrolase [Actinomycetota bacterium]